jgi:hypothetical protein
MNSDQRWLPSGLLCVAILTAAGSASAQAEDQAAARALFDEARRLADAGSYSAACPKFEAANRLFASPGVLLNLGDCYEKIGRTASAWTTFGQADSLATRLGRQDFAAEAERRQQAVAAALSRLVIHVPHEVPGLIIRRDGGELPRAAWETAIPVDPGVHKLEAKAAGYEPWSASVDVSATGQTAAIEIPTLRPVPSPAQGALWAATDPSAPRESASEREGDEIRTAGWALLGAGAALGLAGGAAMLVEAAKASDARTQHDVAEYNATATPWTLGLVGVALGAASAATGVVLLMVNARHEQKQATRGLWIGVGADCLRVGGTW